MNHSPSEMSPADTENGPTIADFRALVADSENRRQEEQTDLRRAAAAQHRDRVKELIDHHIEDADWRALLHRARQAAEGGQKEFTLLRFPADLCSDRGRAINTAQPHWPATLRGEAAEIYLRWERDLKPHGFRLTARILDFPGGFPGDAGLLLVWGE